MLMIFYKDKDGNCGCVFVGKKEVDLLVGVIDVCIVKLIVMVDIFVSCNGIFKLILFG